MSIAIHVHDNDPRALAELIAATIHERGLLDREPRIAHLSLLVDAEERHEIERRAAWRWLNSMSKAIDRDNDWSDV